MAYDQVSYKNKCYKNGQNRVTIFCVPALCLPFQKAIVNVLKNDDPLTLIPTAVRLSLGGRKVNAIGP